MNSFKEAYNDIVKQYNSGEHLRELNDLKTRLKSRPVILYGLGFFGAVAVNNFALHGIEVKCFCDSFKTGTDAETNLPIISPEVLQSEYANANVVITVAAPATHKTVYEYVLSLGFDKNQVFIFDSAYKFFKKSRVEVTNLTLDEMKQYIDGYEWIYSLISDSRKVILDTIRGYLFNDVFEYTNPSKIYFPREIELTDNEIFVDAGLYTGDTTEAFISQTKGEYKRILGFDIDENNLSIARKNLSKYKNIEIIGKGLWSKECELKAEIGITAGSNVNESASTSVPLVALDEVFKDHSPNDYPTFIKMDIEGSEQEAIIGAEKIIKAASPKIAACTYHKPEDIYKIPELLYKMELGYKFMLKHYSPYTWDTVLYAYI